MNGQIEGIREEASGGTDGRRAAVGRIAGLLLAFALLFSGDLVRIHGHPDGGPASSDCVACVAGLSPAIDGGAPPALSPPVPETTEVGHDVAREAPARPFVRRGGLRDPPTPLRLTS
ncbi:MAG: hypothetical protein ACODAA_06195 [Gemmatimonadota bacterium]